MSVRILIVDADEVAVLGHTRALRGLAEVESVATGDAALAALAARGPFAAIVTDLELHDMTGIALLAEAKKRAPGAARIVVSAVEDPKAIAEAVNVGGAFRFFSKPCRPEALLGAVRDAVLEQQRSRRDREVHEQVNSGIVQILTGALLGTEPENSLPGVRMRDRARQAGQASKLPFTADLEMAALLMRLALATVPKHVREKIHVHERLAQEETDLIARIPEVCASVIDHIPRLAGVAEIIRHDGRADDAAGPKRAASREDVPLAARILRALFDLELLETSGLPPPAALLRMQHEQGRYDAAVLKTFERLFVVRQLYSEAEMQERNVEDLISGMILATDAMSTEGVALVSAGTPLTPVLIDRLRNFAELGEVVEPIYVVRLSVPVATAEGAG